MLARRPIQVALALASLSLGTTAFAQPAVYPQWWIDSDVVDLTASQTNDYALVNQGQVKWIAQQAYAELLANGHASQELSDAIDSFSLENGNFMVANSGQLKNIAAPFYDAMGLNYPWPLASIARDDYALANIGQTKLLFAFEYADGSWSHVTRDLTAAFLFAPFSQRSWNGEQGDEVLSVRLSVDSYQPGDLLFLSSVADGVGGWPAAVGLRISVGADSFVLPADNTISVPLSAVFDDGNGPEVEVQLAHDGTSTDIGLDQPVYLLTWRPELTICDSNGDDITIGPQPADSTLSCGVKLIHPPHANGWSFGASFDWENLLSFGSSSGAIALSQEAPVAVLQLSASSHSPSSGGDDIVFTAAIDGAPGEGLHVGSVLFFDVGYTVTGSPVDHYRCDNCNHNYGFGDLGTIDVFPLPSDLSGAQVSLDGGAWTNLHGDTLSFSLGGGDYNIRCRLAAAISTNEFHISSGPVGIDISVPALLSTPDRQNSCTFAAVTDNGPLVSVDEWEPLTPTAIGLGREAVLNVDNGVLSDSGTATGTYDVVAHVAHSGSRPCVVTGILEVVEVTGLRSTYFGSCSEVQPRTASDSDDFILCCPKETGRDANIGLLAASSGSGFPENMPEWGMSVSLTGVDYTYPDPTPAWTTPQHNYPDAGPGLYTFTASTYTGDVHSVTVLVTTVDVDWQGLTEDEEDSDLGRIMGMNDDDDDGDGTVDSADFDNADEDDFAEMTITVSESTFYTGEARIYFRGTAPVNIWTKPGTASRVSGDRIGARGYTLSELGFTPTTRTRSFYCEGRAPGQGALDIHIDPDGLSAPMSRYCGDSVNCTVIDINLTPDWDHDRDIDSDDENQASSSNQFRFWINDDNDDFSSAVSGVDVPGQVGYDPDWKSVSLIGEVLYVDGVRDFVDFFPVHVDLKDTLDLLGTTDYKYVLKHSAGALNALINGELTPRAAGTYLTDQSWCEARDNDELEHISSTGYELPMAFLDGVIAATEGVILAEGRQATEEPLVLETRKASDDSLIFSTELPLKLSGVEQMFCHRNLADNLDTAENQTVTVADRIAPSNLPNNLNARNFVFVHGYNVSQESARGWHSEVFKRLFWSTSNAKFTGVTWHGATGKNYHMAVINAFMTSENVAAQLSFLSGDTTIAAHSLGNMVVSSAIADHGFTPDRYFMLNAAVAIEAYDATQMIGSGINMKDNIRNPDWASYSDRLWANKWHELFPGDSRHDLTWGNRFSSLDSLTAVYNFYSEGEDVVRNADTSIWGMIGAQFDELGAYMWALQEMIKGLDGPLGLFAYNVVMPDQHAGWQFNPAHDTSSISPGTQPPDPATAALLTDEELRTNPLFEPFVAVGVREAIRFPSYDGSELFAPLGDTDANTQAAQSTTQYKLLAESIPALSFAAAANEISSLAPGRNIHMEAQRDGWPSSRPSAPDDNWLHSDLKNVAYPYITQFYDELVTTGGLE